MHFIGNSAIIMADDQPGLQIQYSPGPTVGSFLLPIAGLTLAFYFFSTSESVSILGTLIGGFLTGSAVCGMHYMSQIGLANYSVSYNLAYVFGSAIIAVFASTIALGIFFYSTATWTDSWLKRGLCAALMAASVSGMHWVGILGCEYHLESNNGNPMGGLSREATVIVVICLVSSFLIGPLLTTDADIWNTVRRLLRNSHGFGTHRAAFPSIISKSSTTGCACIRHI